MILNNIAEIRKKKGLTIRQLEYKTGISKSTLSRIENNETKLYLELLEKISKALDCRVQDLFDIV
ncbi:MAG: helix-turn-helix domain-containing protein [Lachnospiraceae bacterium]|nr:MAG TPA: Helix-turn-helix XRE-family like protein [Caudoviricetes sp.]